MGKAPGQMRSGPDRRGGKFCRSGINCRGRGTVRVEKNRDFVGLFGMAWCLLVDRPRWPRDAALIGVWSCCLLLAPRLPRWTPSVSRESWPSSRITRARIEWLNPSSPINRAADVAVLPNSAACAVRSLEYMSLKPALNSLVWAKSLVIRARARLVFASRERLCRERHQFSPSRRHPSSNRSPTGSARVAPHSSSARAAACRSGETLAIRVVRPQSGHCGRRRAGDIPRGLDV